MVQDRQPELPSIILLVAATLVVFAGCTNDAADTDDGKDATSGGAGGGNSGGSDGSTGGDSGGSDGATGGFGASGPPSDPIDPLPAGSDADPRSYFPLPAGAVWRYRDKPRDPENPSPAEDFATSRVVQISGGDEGDEWVRETTTYFNLEIDGEDTRISQTMRETFVLGTPMGDRGPSVATLLIEIEEREVGTQRFVRTLRRQYLPEYQFMGDSYRTGLFDNTQQVQVRLIEERQLRGEAEPTNTEGLIDVVVETDPEEKTEIIAGAYRQKLRKLEFYDDFSAQLVRTIWVQAGVGIVQWQARDAGNVVFELSETNLPDPSAPGP